MEAIRHFRAKGYVVIEVPIEEECLKHTDEARKGKNMWVLGMLCAIYALDDTSVQEKIAARFRKKGDEFVRRNMDLFEAGYSWALENIEYRFHVPATKDYAAHGRHERQSGAGSGNHGRRN